MNKKFWISNQIEVAHSCYDSRYNSFVFHENVLEPTIKF